jgi:hypothetical protein
MPNDLVEARRRGKLAIPILPKNPAVPIKTSPIGSLFEQATPLARACPGKFALKLLQQAKRAQCVQPLAMDAGMRKKPRPHLPDYAKETNTNPSHLVVEDLLFLRAPARTPRLLVLRKKVGQIVITQEMRARRNL